MEQKWYKKALQRNVVDMIIPDWPDERFMSKFDPRSFVEMIDLGGARSIVLYAHSHAGPCFYPTQIGHMHTGLKGRDIFGEMLELCHERDIKVVAYYSLVFDTWLYRTHPEFRIIGIEGTGVADESRYGVCCLNSPYRDHVIRQIKELSTNYEFDGVRFDMTFWPHVCYCRHCRDRFAKEVGGELPVTIDWHDPHWVSFQRKREEWLNEFAALATATVKSLRPNASVEHQCSPLLASWYTCITDDFCRESTFLQADFYGGKRECSFVNKLLHNLTENKPHGFETSIHRNPFDHVTMKPKELLKAKAACALANGGAFIMIDGIDPVGTLNRKVYENMLEVRKGVAPYEKYLGGEMCQDVAIYYSTQSKFDFAENGSRVKTPLSNFSVPHIDAALGAVQALITNHIPFGIITKKNLKELSRHQVLILPNVLMMDEEEVEAITTYVKEGHSIYASKYTSLTDKEGRKHKDFMLSRVFGVSYRGETEGNLSYIAPSRENTNLFQMYSQKYPLHYEGNQMIVTANEGAQTLGRLILPYCTPQEWKNFASCHTNPPGIVTDSPAVVLNKFGKGLALYVAGDIEKSSYHGEIFIEFIKSIASRPFTFQSDAPKAVEITAFHQEDKKRYIINLVNFQEELPNIPVNGLEVKIFLDHKKAKRVMSLPDETELTFESQEGYLRLTAPQINTFVMLAVDYE